MCFCVYEMCVQKENKGVIGCQAASCFSQEYEREKHAHSVLQFQFSEMKETLKQSEELLNVSICPSVGMCLTKSVKQGAEMEPPVG